MPWIKYHGNRHWHHIFYFTKASFIKLALLCHRYSTDFFFLTAFYEMLMKQNFIKMTIIIKMVLPTVRRSRYNGYMHAPCVCARQVLWYKKNTKIPLPPKPRFLSGQIFQDSPLQLPFFHYRKIPSGLYIQYGLENGISTINCVGKQSTFISAFISPARIYSDKSARKLARSLANI